MQNIDFGKLRGAAGPSARPSLKDHTRTGNNKEKKPISRSLITTLFIICAFTFGIVSGMKIQKLKYANAIETNVTSVEKNNNFASTHSMAEPESNNTQSQPIPVAKLDEPALPVDKSKYMIFARRFKDTGLAFKKGYLLKRSELLQVNKIKVRIRKEGSKAGLYIGPILGKKLAYVILGKLSRNPGINGVVFSQAILRPKSN